MESTSTTGVADENIRRLLNIPQRLRKSEDVFEIANGLYQASFVRQLDVVTRSSIARCAEAYEIEPGAHVHLSVEGENALYIILSGSVKAEAAGLEFPAGDTFGFRTPASPSFQLMVDLPVVTCATRGLAAKITFEHCLRLWPGEEDRDSKDPQQEQTAGVPQPGGVAEPSKTLVWSPELAKSILLRGGAEAEEVLVALEFLNFPPINGYSTEVREILVSHFKLRSEGHGGVFLEWTNRMPVDPNDIQLSRVDCDQVAIVVSGCLRATCRRRKTALSTRSETPQSLQQSDLDSIGGNEGTAGGERHVQFGGINGSETTTCSRSTNNSNTLIIKEHTILKGDGRTNHHDTHKHTGISDPHNHQVINCDAISDGSGHGPRDGSNYGDEDGEFTLTTLQAGGVFPAQISQMMMGSRNRKDENDFDQDVGDDWKDFDLCKLVGDSSAPATEVLLVDAHTFHDVIYPGVDLCYSMEPVRRTLAKTPGLRTWREISYIARNVLSHHVAFQQMAALSLERIASRLTNRTVVAGGEVLVEHGKKVTGFLILLRGSARIMEVSKVIRGDVELVRAAEKQASGEHPVGARTMRSLAVPPERRTRRDVKNIVNELSTPKGGLDIARFRHVPACLKTRLAAALRLEVWPAFSELMRDEKDPKTYLFIVKGSISLQAVTKANRFTVETLDIPAAGHLKKLDVDNALSLEDWRASGLGPCAAMHCDRQVLGEYPNSEESVLSVRAVTREETTAAVVDSEIYANGLARENYSDSHSAVCREVLAQLKRCPSDNVVPGVAGLEAEMLCRLLKENPVLKRINGPCFPRLTGSIALTRYKPGEVVTEEEDFGDSLYIILEGRLEYAVKDSHRGVIDRSLAKEVGIAPGLRCVGVMTAGDFFAPESMLGRSKGRRPRVLASGSYRVRCSPDIQDGGAGSDGATCFVLPRGKVEAAVHRDHHMKRSRLFQSNQSNHNNNSAVDSKGLTMSPIAEHHQTANISGLSKDELARVCFGGPGEPPGLAYLSLAGGGPVEGGRRQPGGGGRDVAAERAGTAAVGEPKNVAGGNALAEDCGVGGSNLPAPSSMQVVAGASAGAAEASGGGGGLTQGRAFLTGVPSTHINTERLVSQAPTGAISTSVSSLQGMEGSCPSDSATLASGVMAGGRGGDDAGFGVGDLPTVGGGSAEGGGNAKQAEEASQSRHDGPLVSSIANSSVTDSTDFPQPLSATDHSTEAVTAAAAQPWSDTSECCSDRCWAVDASAGSEVPKSWQMGTSRCSISPAVAATSDGESHCSACGLGDRVAGSSRGGGSSMCSAGLDDSDGNGSKPHNSNNNNKSGDSSNENGGLINRMRSHIYSHADPSENQHRRHPRVRRATWRLTPSSGDDDNEALRGDDLVSRDLRSRSGSDNGWGQGRGRRAADRLLPAGQEQTNRSASEGRPRRHLWREPCVAVSGSRKRMTTPRSCSPEGGDDTVASAIPPVQPPTWSRPSRKRPSYGRETLIEDEQKSATTGGVSSRRGTRRPEGDDATHPPTGPVDVVGSESDGDSEKSKICTNTTSRNATPITAPSTRWQDGRDVVETRGQQERYTTHTPQDFSDKKSGDPTCGITGDFTAVSHGRVGNEAPTTIGRATISAPTEIGRRGHPRATIHQSQQHRPCTGAPSHGWRSFVGPGGDHRMPTGSAKHNRNCVSKVDPTVLSKLPAAHDGFFGSESHYGAVPGAVGEGKGLIEGVSSAEDGCPPPTTARCGINAGSGVRSRKQPAVVRRLKITLQALNDPHSDA
ncbi:unnamed protein product [Ectocarpus sp. 12 AP-2014]